MKIYLLLFFALIPTLLFSQSTSYPKNYFRSPVDIPIFLAGTMCELRPNHYHGGIDIKTQQREGLNLYAVAEGYVSRINVSGKGYGNALYITHPNGYVSVYGHMKNFSSKIKEVLRNKQYSEQKSEIDFTLDPQSLPVYKGEVIGLSGNTGGSQGPHLHFEIRDAVTEEGINPMLFGFDINDTQRPNISNLMVYEFDEQQKQLSRFKGVLNKVSYGQYTANKIVTSSPYVSFAINSVDAMNGSDNNNGIYSITTYLDGEAQFRYSTERYSIVNTRAIHAHIDYPYFDATGSRVHRCHKLKGDMQNMYPINNNNGIMQLYDNAPHNVRIVSEDANGNSSELNFVIQYNKPLEEKYWQAPAHIQMLPYDAYSHFENGQIACDFPGDNFYEDVYLKHYTIPSGNNALSDIHVLGSESIPVHSYYQIKIKPYMQPLGYDDKLIIIHEADNGKKTNCGGNWNGQYVEGKTRAFGKFFISKDVTPPTITANYSATKSYSLGQTISFRIADNLSGIKTFDLYINNQWCVMEYDQKSNKIWYTIDERLSSGRHTLNLIVKDERGNTQTYEGSISIL